MKKPLPLLLWALLLTLSAGAQPGTWTQKTGFATSGRYRAAAFVVNGKAYLGTGATTTGISQNLNDLWEYDPQADSWSQKASLPGPARTNATAVGTATKGYLGFGSNNGTLLNDWWSYEPATNLWQQLASLPGPARTGAVAFAIGTPIGDNIFAGGGLTGGYWPSAQLFLYNPLANTWTPKAALPQGLTSAAAFALNGKGYVVAGGRNSGAGVLARVSEYDPVTNTWTNKADFGGGPRLAPVGFALGTKGYVGAGFATTAKDDCWEFDPVANTWTAMANFMGGKRHWAAAFAVGSKGYVSTGTDSASTFYNDLWSFSPTVTGLGSVELRASGFELWPNPTTGMVHLAGAKAEQAHLYDVQGRLVRTMPLVHGQTTADLMGLPAGAYVLRCGSVARRVIVE